jgi:hypothetical protein
MSIWGDGMPKSGQNSTGERNGSGSLPSDCLPEYSLRPKYTITTIYPSPAESLLIEKGPEAINLFNSAAISPPIENGESQVLSQQTEGTADKPDWHRALSMPVQGAASQTVQESRSGVMSGVRVHGGSAGFPGKHHLKYRSERGGAGNIRSMELPRGRFRGMQRNVRLTHLLRDLSESYFTGFCRITHDQNVMILVLDNGEVVLAGHGDFAGLDAWNKILSFANMFVDAQLNELSEPQLNLALEFNPEWKVEGASLSDCRSDTMAEDHRDRPGFDDRSVQGGEESQELPTIHALTPPESEQRMKKVSEAKPVVAFEPLETDSALFETKAEVREKRPTQVCDVPEQWRLMSVNRRENLSV